MKYYVYILYSSKSSLYYVGQTDDISERLKYHNELSDNSYTSKHRPWELKICFEVGTRGLAMRIERHIKKQKSRSYIESIISRKSISGLVSRYSK